MKFQQKVSMSLLTEFNAGPWYTRALLRILRCIRFPCPSPFDLLTFPIWNKTILLVLLAVVAATINFTLRDKPFS